VRYLFDIQAKTNMIKQNIGRVLLGKEKAVELALTALVCGGHLLIEDAPGLGKTTLATGLAKSLGCSFGRIQFTPDLLPSDIMGFTIYDINTGQKTLCPGGVMHQLVLADEINRTSPKTQSALLEAMQEYQVTVDSQTIDLPRPFMVMATQNPLEFAGTYPLPEAQMDRFFMRIRLGYPSLNEEIDILSYHQGGNGGPDLQAVLSAEEVLQMQQALYSVDISQAVKHYISKISEASRKHKEIELPISPRGSIALMRAAMGRALLLGRAYTLPDDVQEMAEAVLAHRLGLSPAYRAKKRNGEMILKEILATLPVPAAS
jgi:MoxR-like ATPase